MPRILKMLSAALLLTSAVSAAAAESPQATDSAKPTQQELKNTVEQLDKPLYNPFIERYVIDELKQLRTDMAATKAELIEKVVNKELTSVDRAVTYATDTVTYFFYLIAGASSLLVLAGWTSIRDIKERVHSLADEEITKLVTEYEGRLAAIERQLNQKSLDIEENREEIELTQEVQSLWLRAARETHPTGKIAVYDQILTLRKDDCEALTYKADAVLELDEPQWAANLCHQALSIDPENSHAFYQLACAYTALEQYDEAIRYLAETFSRSENFRDEVMQDPALRPLRKQEAFEELLQGNLPGSGNT